MYVKIFNGACLVACLVALAIVLAGMGESVEKFFSPGGGFDKGTADIAQTPSNQARGVDSEVRIQSLLRTVPFETVGGPINAKELEKKLKESEPGARLGEPLERGGIKMRVEGSVVLFCAHPVDYVCSGYNTQTRSTSDGQGLTLPAAQREALGL